MTGKYTTKRLWRTWPACRSSRLHVDLVRRLSPPSVGVFTGCASPGETVTTSRENLYHSVLRLAVTFIHVDRLSYVVVGIEILLFAACQKLTL